MTLHVGCLVPPRQPALGRVSWFLGGNKAVPEEEEAGAVVLGLG